MISDVECKIKWGFFTASCENTKNVRNGKVFSVLLAAFHLVRWGMARLLEETCRWHKKRIFKILSSCTMLSGYQGNCEEIRDYEGILNIDFS